MTRDRKTKLESWFENRHVRLEWQKEESTRANLIVLPGRKGGDAKSEFESKLPGHLLTRISSLVEHEFSGPTDDIVAWLPNGWPGCRTQCIASSRIGRHPEKHPWWIDAVRTSSVNGFRDGAALLTGEGMTAGPFVRRMAHLLNCELVDIRISPKNPVAKWFRKKAESDHPDSVFPVWIFSFESDLPNGWIDEFAVGLADSVRVISVSEGGNVLNAVKRRLESTVNDGSVWLLADQHATSEKLKQELSEQGAVQWLLQDVAPADKPHTRPFLEEIIDLPDDADEFLAHWTRARGRHPGMESDDERIDRLLFGLAPDSEGAIGTLLSILCMRRLVAGASLTRDSTPVVSFTGVPLREFPSRRTFRSHLGRWDFELFGIAIRKSVLEKLGARPVIYGDENKWSSLPEPDRPWFQLTHGNSVPASIDWSREREWRITGDVDLARIAADELFVFVPDRESAERVSKFSRWPVAILPRKPLPAD